MSPHNVLSFLRPHLKVWTLDNHVENRQYACSPGGIRIPEYREHGVCLLQRDWISNRIRKFGRWPDCDILVKLWHASYFYQRHSDYSRDLFVDVGANIGACTVEMLIRTNASVIAIEPNPKSLFHLQKSLLMLKETLPHVSQRVVVLPYALGQRYVRNASIFTVKGNQGNSVLTHEIKDKPSDKTEETSGISVLRLDDVIPRSVYTRVMKLDVQGYECKVLHGAESMLDRLHSISVEADDRFLRIQGCGVRRLRDVLTMRGFNVSTQRTLTEDTFTGVRIQKTH